MDGHSILFRDADESPTGEVREPAPCVHDLHLDQIVEAITAPWNEYNLTAVFHAPLTSVEAIEYRQAIMRDLEDQRAMRVVESFARQMRTMRARLDKARTLGYRYATARCFLGAVRIYVEAVERLSHDLAPLDLMSDGMRGLREYVVRYVASDGFRTLVAESGALVAALAAIRYCVLINGSAVTVRHYEGERNSSAAVEETFAQFRRGAAKDYRTDFRTWGDINHVEAQILDRVALLNAGPFRSLDAFSEAHANYLDPTIVRFDREIHFYVAYLAFIEPLRRAGLSFCYPRLSADSKEIGSHNSFDLALAARLAAEQRAVVPNDFYLHAAERILVVSGPNQGGKTTFARMFGQLHYVARLGCPVPGTEARLFLCDRLFTHFERQEDITNLRGKLKDDLIRIGRIFDEATPRSIIVMNEIFSSTTVQDARFLGSKVMERLSALDALAVCVTFLDELASFNEKTVSLVSTVDPENPAIRTYKLVRRPADGLAYALAIAERHHVTYAWLKRRIAP